MLSLLLLLAWSDEDLFENQTSIFTFESDEFPIASRLPAASPPPSATADSQTPPTLTSDLRPPASPTPDDWIPDDGHDEDHLAHVISTLIFVLLVLVMLTLVSVMGICCYRRLKRTRAMEREEERVDEPLLVTDEVF
jgi:hypothetical protein